MATSGTHVVDGDELDIAVVEDLEYGLVSEWDNGLDSPQRAMNDPEVIEREEDRATLEEQKRRYVFLVE